MASDGFMTSDLRVMKVGLQRDHASNSNTCFLPGRLFNPTQSINRLSVHRVAITLDLDQTVESDNLVCLWTSFDPQAATVE
uniref:Uncharacterized protein n=1 Tax=Physcomitrium patens TaxID=3218 RepID=A0A2K1J4N5_PHYPA|nr:hypothetical protein PHYPA_022340 [Physcomitrium patens]